ncbi:hypothetical protein CORC01_00459 [Colletotrichum orchidophilum]|uniref:Uncharacterized protein n=1 Tax=Colletotrichum orchidophilum TaxID=1209926 RepID=A0A1G4BRW9_9PEZI|nr:uncharacterized protein CORC01_00459 [Colletotrichum orchidophilum]OHF04120.1 hypothetical protein CORC01_00459 [Colletotrichum orchidophilum]
MRANTPFSPVTSQIVLCDPFAKQAAVAAIALSFHTWFQISSSLSNPLKFLGLKRTLSIVASNPTLEKDMVLFVKSLMDCHFGLPWMSRDVTRPTDVRLNIWTRKLLLSWLEKVYGPSARERVFESVKLLRVLHLDLGRGAEGGDFKIG